MKPALYAVSCVLLLSSLASGQDAASADDAPADDAPAGETSAATQSARAHFRLGVDFYRERNYRAALIEFQRAYADAPHYKLLYNLGQASLELQEYASAIDFLSAYLRQGGNEIAAERRNEVEDSIRYLESRIAHISVVSNRSGAELYVDDTLVGKSPLNAPVRVGAGRHKFTATLPGAASVERQLDVAAGDARELRLDFIASGIDEPASAQEPVRPYESYEESPDESSSVAPVVLAITTGVLAAGALTLTIITGIAQQDYQEERLVLTTSTKLDSLREDAETKALVTDILWGATLASAIVTTVLFLTVDDTNHSKYSASRARLLAARNTQHVKLNGGPSGIAVDGRF